VEIDNNRRHLKPGVMEFLDALRNAGVFWLGLLTGNIEKGARIKLGAFGLNEYFAAGAFGDDNEDRNSLLPVAVERFSRISGVEIQFRDCVVIGDTPRDVQCSKPFGAVSIAVSTGRYSHEHLLETGAHHVLKDLTDATDIIDDL
jgi:phosphoglycolate phosphatase-like HAD superfamily hydrolase